MPVQKSQGSLLAKMGERLKKAHAQHKNDQADYGNRTLPPGIEGGVARLTKCYIKEFKEGDNKGKPFFFAQGSVIEPVEFNGMETEGLLTQIGPIPLCDTPKSMGKYKTFEDYYGLVLNHIRILLFTQQEIAKGANIDFDEGDIDSAIERLETEQPTFRFRTWQGKKQVTGPYAGREPRIVQEWNGKCEYNSQVVQGSAMEDNTSSVPDQTSENGETEGAPITNPQEVATEGPLDEFGDIDSLVKKADEGDDTAAAELTSLAKKAGVSAKAISTAEKWEDVAVLIQKADSTGEAQEVKNPSSIPMPDEPVWQPKMEEVYKYAPPDPKTKRPGRPTECEVVGVSVKMSTVDLKNLDNGKTIYKGVKWSEIQGK